MPLRHSAILISRLFLGGDDLEALKKIEKSAEHVDTPMQYNAEVSAELSAIVLKALAHDPSDRYPSLEEFHEALVALMTSEQRMLLRDASAVYLDGLMKGRAAGEPLDH